MITERPRSAKQQQKLTEAIDAIFGVVQINKATIQMALAALLARGHVLFEDVPGVGKTTLARALARVLGCSFSRVQFTSDLLPTDVLGTHVLETNAASSTQFRFHQGPIFANIVLADEINRASPKTQSAMLEAMADAQVTTGETTYALPNPFMVIATQNPLEHHGTYPLPESQLDRFMLRLSVGYPTSQDEKQLLLAPNRVQKSFDALAVSFTQETLIAAQEAVLTVHLDEAVASYLLALVKQTRNHPDLLLGCSTRGAIAFALVARAWALLQGRNYVIPDDIKQLAPYVLCHRLLLKSSQGQSHEAALLVENLLSQLPIPRP